ncbi:hypothetical protein IGI04_005438 [Brassica rapa subsp. trilocularis]|uniref:Uncharacterized protein n=1 Tax=Brassica rapa subsp. trilocularis TaxID=1813537 RepID=A0ABQ7NE04_BRACM|nr:hypothetical protein IGI04_005438 [Brassica rapa subsp. trilocularis]
MPGGYRVNEPNKLEKALSVTENISQTNYQKGILQKRKSFRALLLRFFSTSEDGKQFTSFFHIGKKAKGVS